MDADEVTVKRLVFAALSAVLVAHDQPASDSVFCDEHAAPSAGCGSQCAICLGDIAAENLAVVKGCDHAYCATCILRWAATKPGAPTCPSCKAPFARLLVHRHLDGALSDLPLDEPVTFLLRAPWFQAWQAEQQAIRDLSRHAVFRSVEVAASDRSPLALAQEEWAEEALYGFFEAEYDEDEDLADYYLAPGGGASGSRPVFGNRRWGANGYVRSGRRQGAPVQPAPGKAWGQAAKAAAGGASTSASAGRRARRKARQSAQDANGAVPGFE